MAQVSALASLSGSALAGSHGRRRDAPGTAGPGSDAAGAADSPADIKVVESSRCCAGESWPSARAPDWTGISLVILLVARANNRQSFRRKALALRPRKRPQRSISRTFYANIRWLRRPGPWPGAEVVTLHRTGSDAPRQRRQPPPPPVPPPPPPVPRRRRRQPWAADDSALVNRRWPPSPPPVRPRTAAEATRASAGCKCLCVRARMCCLRVQTFLMLIGAVTDHGGSRMACLMMMSPKSA